MSGYIIENWANSRI